MLPAVAAGCGAGAASGIVANGSWLLPPLIGIVSGFTVVAIVRMYRHVRDLMRGEAG